MTVEKITAIIRLIVIIITGFLLPALRTWIRTRTDNEKLNKVKEWAYVVVWAAEQVHNKAKHDDPAGTLRRRYAYESINFMAEKTGINLTPDEINAMIECAVHELNGCRIPATNEISAPDKEKGESKNAEWY